MSFRIHLSHAPIPPGHVVHPGLTGYLAVLHDQENEQTLHVGFLAPIDLLPQAPGPFPGAKRLIAWLVRGIAVHDKHQSPQAASRWLTIAVVTSAGRRPLIIMPDLPDVDPIEWKPGASLSDLRAMAEADLVAMDLRASVDHPPHDTQDIPSRL